MIKGIMSGPGLVVNGGNPSLPYVNINNYGNNANPMQGMVRINGTDMQVFDGTTWMNVSSSFATVELNGDSQSLLQWAREQRDKQSKREQLVKKNPALQKALEAIQRAEDNFDLLEKFVEHDQQSESESVQAGP